MKKILTRLSYLSFAAFAFLLLALATNLLVLRPSTHTSFPAKAFADGNLGWTGHGATNGLLDSVDCDQNNTPYLLWVFTTGGSSTVTSATLSLGGSGSGSYPMSQSGNEWKATTNFFSLNTLTASVSYVGGLGNGSVNLNISHGCPGSTTSPTPTSSPTPTPSTSPSPTPTGSPAPTHYACNTDRFCELVEGAGVNSCNPQNEGSDCNEATPTPTPTPTPTAAPTSNPGGGSGDGGSDNLGCGSHDCSGNASSRSTGGQVLGASTGPTQAVLGLSTTSGDSTTLLSFIQLAAAFGFVSLGFGLFKKNA